MPPILQISQSTLQGSVTSAQATQAGTAAATKHFTISHTQAGIIKPVFIGREREAGNVGWHSPHILYKSTIGFSNFTWITSSGKFSTITKQNVMLSSWCQDGTPRHWLNSLGLTVGFYSLFLCSSFSSFLSSSFAFPTHNVFAGRDKPRSGQCVIHFRMVLSHSLPSIVPLLFFFKSRKLLEIKLQ